MPLLVENSPAVMTYAAVLFGAGLLALGLSWLAWLRRPTPGSLPMTALMAAMWIWCWAYAMHWLTPAWPSLYFWHGVSFIGVVGVPFAMFAFAAQMTDHAGWLTRRSLILLSIEPIITLLLVWTDPMHQLFFGGLRDLRVTDLYQGGPWFWLNVIYSYSLIIFSYILLIISFFKSHAAIYRHQMGIGLVGMTLHWGLNIAYLLGFRVLPGLDLTPISFLVSGSFFAISILAFRTFDLTPVSQSVLMDQMQDGLLVVDTINRVVGLNRVGAELLGGDRSALIGRPASEVLAHLPELEQVLHDFQPLSTQVEVPGDPPRVLDVQVSPLYARNQKLRGYLMAWREVTHMKRIEDQLREANQILTDQLVQIENLQSTLREQTIRDPLTGLFNRRFLETTLPKEMIRAAHMGLPVSFLMIDVDHFKRINDIFGHDSGDQVLIQVSAMIETNTRQGDWVVRYGGEEFLVIMVGAPLGAAMQRAEQLRAKISAATFVSGSDQHSVTVSVGVAAHPPQACEHTELIRFADQALYQAKSAGRNCVCKA